MEWTEQLVEIDKLKFYEKNPRNLSEKDERELRKSLTKFGQCEPIVINEDYTIIGGHQRVRTMRGMGLQTVVVHVPSRRLNDREVEELNIRLNKNSGSWDFDVLANSWDVIDLLDWGFTEDELGLGEVEEKPKKESYGINIKLESKYDVIDLENKLSHIIDGYEGASYKVKM